MRPHAAARCLVAGLGAAALYCAAPPAPTELASPTSAHPVEAPPAAVPFIDNDYARALAEAKARDLPLFVESWAPW